jgi:hypothetical protein
VVALPRHQAAVVTERKKKQMVSKKIKAKTTGRTDHMWKDKMADKPANKIAVKVAAGLCNIMGLKPCR